MSRSSRSPFAKPSTPQLARPDTTRPVKGAGGAAWAVTRAVAKATAAVTRAVSAQLWLYRAFLAPVVAPLLVWVALGRVAGALPAGLGYAVQVLAVAPVAYWFGRAGWSRSGAAAAKARVRNEKMLRRIRTEWEDICYASGLTNRTDSYPGIASGTTTRAGVLLRLTLPRGMEIGDLRARTGELASAFQCERVTVSPGNRKNASQVEVLVVFDDPLGESAGPTPLLAAPTGTDSTASSAAATVPARKVSDPVPLGVDEHGKAVTTTLVEQNILVGGLPGAGKSAAIQGLVAAYALCSPEKARLYLFDPKIVELARWRDRAVEFVGKDEWDKAIAVLRQIRAELDAAYAKMAADGTARKFRPDVDTFTLIVIDELASYTADAPANVKAEFNGLLANIVRMGRAAGFAILAGTQRPTKEVLSAGAKNLFSLRVAMRTGASGDSQVILGDAVGRFADASTIDADTPGVCFFKSETGTEAVRLRTYYLDDDTLEVLVARAGTATGTTNGTGTGKASTPAPAPDTAATPTQPAGPAQTAAGAGVRHVPAPQVRTLPKAAALDGEALTLDVAAVTLTEKHLGQLRRTHPEVTTLEGANLLLAKTLAPLHGTAVPASVGRRQWGYWVAAGQLEVMLNSAHKVCGVYPREHA